jgi:hypothetical protein
MGHDGFAANHRVAGLDADPLQLACNRGRDDIGIAYPRAAFLVDGQMHGSNRHLSHIHHGRLGPEGHRQGACNQQHDAGGQDQAGSSRCFGHGGYSLVFRAETNSVRSISRFTSQPEAMAAPSTTIAAKP